MWVMVMFDLPVGSKEERRAYTRFRQKLLDNGYWQLQYSVYAKPCATDDLARKHRDRIEKHVPAHGQVRIIMFTDKQWERMEVFIGKKPVTTEKQPDQLAFF